MKKRDKYNALIAAVEKHRRAGEEHRIIALALEDEAKTLKRRSITGRFWGSDED